MKKGPEPSYNFNEILEIESIDGDSGLRDEEVSVADLENRTIEEGPINFE